MTEPSVSRDFMLQCFTVIGDMYELKDDGDYEINTNIDTPILEEFYKRVASESDKVVPNTVWLMAMLATMMAEYCHLSGETMSDMLWIHSLELAAM